MIRNLLAASSLTLLTLSASAADGAADTTSLAKAREAFSHYLSAWAAGHAPAENIKDIFAADAVMEITIPERNEWSLHIDGRSAISRFVQEGIRAGSAWSFDNLHLFPTSRDDVVFAQYTSTAWIDGSPVRQNSLVVIELDGTQIKRLQDLNGSPAVIAALRGTHRLAAHQDGDAPGQ